MSRPRAVFGVPVDTGAAEWKSLGFCRSYGWPELWFPEGPTLERKALEKVAVGYCQNSCPVMLECRRYALENRETWGVWGALRQSELRRLVGKAGQ